MQLRSPVRDHRGDRESPGGSEPARLQRRNGMRTALRGLGARMRHARGSGQRVTDCATVLTHDQAQNGINASSSPMSCKGGTTAGMDQVPVPALKV